jgi:chromosome segregation ATPase
MYYDEALAQSFDELLDSGYTVVQSKKQEREQLRKQEETFLNEIAAVEKEIIPLISKMMTLKDKVANQKELKEKYEAEITILRDENDEIKSTIEQRVEDIKNNEKDLMNKIRRIESENNQIRNETAQNKTNHKGEKDQWSATLKTKTDELNGLVTKLNKIKAKHESRKQEVSEKLRKMENKSKMFIGILKH